MKIKRKKLGVPMQIFALSCDKLAKNTEIHRYFYQISTFRQITKKIDVQIKVWKYLLLL